MFQHLFNAANRKIRKEIASWVLKRPEPKFGEGGSFLRPEIEARHFRVSVPLAGEKPRHISAIFAQQGTHIIFRMSLNEEKKATFILRKQIDAGVCRT